MAKQLADKKLTVNERLDAIGIDAICDLIEQDYSYRAIASMYGVPEPQLSTWITKGQTVTEEGTVNHSARAKESLIKAAKWNDDQALKVLEDLKPDSTPAEIARAREIAQHRRWRARSRSPKEYGDKITHSGDPENPIQTVSRIELVPFSPNE